MSKIIFVLSFACICLFAKSAKCQSDSLKIFFVGAGFKGEKFKIYHGSDKILTFKADDYFKYSFAIPKNLKWKYGDKISLHIMRKCKLCLFHKDTEFNPFYDPNYKYLIIKRDPVLKNKYAVSYRWSNEEPYLIK